MCTVFHLLSLVGFLGGSALGVLGGAKLFGVSGGIAGCLLGGAFGFALGQIPSLLVLRLIARDLTAKTTAELRAYLENPNCPTPNLVLLELRSRGEDIRQELPVVLDMLSANDVGRRGWAALTSAYLELVPQLGDYRLEDPVDECRKKAGRLRSMV